MYKFIFRLNDGSKEVMENVTDEKADCIWSHINKYCAKYETPTNKVVTVRQELMK